MSRWLSGFLLFLLSCSAPAIDRIQLEWDSIASEGWRISGITVSLDLMPSGDVALSVSAALLEVGDQRVEKLNLLCPAFDWRADEVDCRHGFLSLQSEWVVAERVPTSVNYRFDSQQLKFSLAELPLAGGKTELTFHHQRSGWQLNAKLTRTALGTMAGLLAKAGLKLPRIDYQGTLGGELAVHGDAHGVKDFGWRLRTTESGYSNAQGDQAAEGLVLVSNGTAVAQQGDWHIQASLAARQGMLYSEPVYLEFSEVKPLELSADATWRAKSGELLLGSVEFNQPGIARGSLKATLAPGAEKFLQQLELDIGQGLFPGLYDTWLQPWLAGTVLENLETEGRIQTRLIVRDARPASIEMILNDVSFRERDDLFGAQKLLGELHWSDSGTSPDSVLAWQGANYHQLKLGAAKVGLQTDPQGVKLKQPLVVPLLDGGLHIDQFELGVDPQGMRWLIDAMLTPVSMKAFTTALGWPPLSGKLSGMVPKVRYEQGELTLGGTLLVQAFDGSITVRNLRIQRPLGLVPRLWADIRLENLDLKTLTKTFSFGRIEGRLQGAVEDLYMEAWQLVAFDAHFETPADDDSDHRISQKAVDNISNLGGAGVGGAVSRSFLRFLEDFPYRRLGIRCRLQNGVCQMGGVAPATTGYYLVQGSVLPPRLDVIGYSKEVDWQSLVDRLVSITTSDAPIVE
ncbi:hypothetical protein [Thiogranum longum]